MAKLRPYLPVILYFACMLVLLVGLLLPIVLNSRRIVRYTTGQLAVQYQSAWWQWKHELNCDSEEECRLYAFPKPDHVVAQVVR